MKLVRLLLFQDDYMRGTFRVQTQRPREPSPKVMKRDRNGGLLI